MLPQRGASAGWTAFDPGRVGVDPSLLQGDLGSRARWKKGLPEGTSHGKKKRTLQLLIDEGSPYVEYFEWFLKAHVYAALTHNWHFIQAVGFQTSKSNIYMKNNFDLLELD